MLKWDSGEMITRKMKRWLKLLWWSPKKKWVLPARYCVTFMGHKNEMKINLLCHCRITLSLIFILLHWLDDKLHNARVKHSKSIERNVLFDLVCCYHLLFSPKHTFSSRCHRLSFCSHYRHLLMLSLHHHVVCALVSSIFCSWSCLWQALGTKPSFNRTAKALTNEIDELMKMKNWILWFRNIQKFMLKNKKKKTKHEKLQ